MKFDNIQYQKSVQSWEEAVIQSSVPLFEKGFIDKSYQEAMIQNINTNGTYMVLMPGIIMPHARPEDGVKETSVSFLFLEEEVIFPEDNSIWLVISLAASSAEAHVETIEKIVDLLMDEDQLAKLKQARSIDEIKVLF